MKRRIFLKKFYLENDWLLHVKIYPIRHFGYMSKSIRYMYVQLDILDIYPNQLDNLNICSNQLDIYMSN